MQVDRGVPLLPTGVDIARSTNPRAWVLRPIVWFAAASMVTTILHELTHACVAYALGVRSTLFNYSVDLELTRAQAATHQRALIGVAGPLFCLGFGMLGWLAFRRARGSAAELPLLYLTVFGIGTFFGNLMSTSFVGDFSSAAIALGLPMGVRYAITVIGALSVAAIHFWGGRELVQWVPANVGRVIGMLGIIALPVVLGTAAVILVNQPLPGSSAAARFTEAAFWLFAAFGALVTRRHSQNGRGRLGLRWVDGTATLLAVLVVRLMARAESRLGRNPATHHRASWLTDEWSRRARYPVLSCRHGAAACDTE